MQSSTSGQTPSQSNKRRKIQQSTRRKLVPTIDPDMLKPLNNCSALPADLNIDDPTVRSGAVEWLKVLSLLMQQLVFAKNVNGIRYAAGDSDLPHNILGIAHNPMGTLWHRPEIGNSPPATLSPNVDGVIHRFRFSKYHPIDNSEASVRVAVGLIIHDRLRHLIDQGSSEKASVKPLELYPDVDIHLLRRNTYITGRASWLLCNDDPQYGLGSTLTAIETRRKGQLSFARPQIATNLVAVQESRFGIRTDTMDYQFWLMDSEQHLYSSGTFDWRIHKAKTIE